MKFATHFCLSRFLRVWFTLILAISLLTTPAFAADAPDENAPDDAEITQEATPQPIPAKPDPSTMPQPIPDRDEISDEDTSIIDEEINDDERPKDRLNIASWITDSNGDITKQLYANATYTVHTRAEVIGEVAAERAIIWVYGMADPWAVPNRNSQRYASIVVGAIGDNVGYDSSEAQFRSATEDCLWADYVPNSARLAMAGEGGAIDIDDTELFNYKLGVLLGYDAADGNLPVGREYACEITFQIETSPFRKNLPTDASANETNDPASTEDADQADAPLLPEDPAEVDESSADNANNSNPAIRIVGDITRNVIGNLIGFCIGISVCILFVSWRTKRREKRDRKPK